MVYSPNELLSQSNQWTHINYACHNTSFLYMMRSFLFQFVNKWAIITDFIFIIT